MTKNRLEELLANAINILSYYEPEDTEYWVCTELGMTRTEWNELTSTEAQLRRALRKGH